MNCFICNLPNTVTCDTCGKPTCILHVLPMEHYCLSSPPDLINSPPHYGGKANPYEAIKVIEAWRLGFHLGNTVKYISRAGKKGPRLEDLEKAKWYLDREIENEKGNTRTETSKEA